MTKETLMINALINSGKYDQTTANQITQICFKPYKIIHYLFRNRQEFERELLANHLDLEHKIETIVNDVMLIVNVADLITNAEKY